MARRKKLGQVEGRNVTFIGECAAGRILRKIDRFLSASAGSKAIMTERATSSSKRPAPPSGYWHSSKTEWEKVARKFQDWRKKQAMETL